MASTAAFASGEAMALAIKAALGPVLERQAVLMEKCSRLEADLATVRPELVALRERAAVLETRAPVPGPPGTPGRDGFTVDEFTAVQDPDDDRIVTLAYRRGDHVKTIGTLQFQTPRFCGVWSGARTYSKGDQVTHGGALWTCHTATRARPGDGDDNGWQLQVKRGDGR